MRDATSRLLLLCVSTGFALVAAELAIRGFDLGPEIRPVYRENFRLSENPVLGYELAPESPDGESRINSDGFRGSEVRRPRRAATRRIAVIGDSIAFGHDVEAHQAFPAQMERYLNRDLANTGADYEVLNFGVSGYGVAQAVETLRSRALQLDPDIVVYAYCLNDAQAYSLEMANLIALTSPAERSYLARAATDHLRVVALARFGLAQLTASGRRGEEQLWNRDDPQFVAIEGGHYQGYFEGLYRDHESWQRVTAGFDALAKISRDESLPVLVVLFPLLIDLDHYALERLHERLRAALAERSLPVLDLTAVYAQAFRDDLPRLALDPLHPTLRGHRAAALAVLYRMLADGLIEGENLRSYARLEAHAKAGSRDANLAVQVRRGMEGS